MMAASSLTAASTWETSWGSAKVRVSKGLFDSEAAFEIDVM